MKDLKITDEITEQIELGKLLIHEKASVYTSSLIKSIQDVIERCYPNFKRKDLTVQDLLYISIYDYWTVGNTVAEGLYYRFIEKSFNEKKQFITLRDRLKYTELLNTKEDAHLLTYKFEAYEILKDLYKREIIRISEPSHYKAFKDFVLKHPKFVAKPEGASMSLGVHLVDSSEYDSLDTLFNQLLNEAKTGSDICSWCDSQSVVLEEIIEQSEVMSSLHPASINNLRCISIRNGDNVDIFYPCVKIGMNNEFICSGATGSIIAAVDAETGIVTTNGKTEILTQYDIHPDTGIAIQGFRIPEWEEMISVVRQAAMKFPSIPFIGWDVVHSKMGWCIMEGNYATEFVCCQLPYQIGFKNKFEDKTGIYLDPKRLWWER